MKVLSFLLIVLLTACGNPQSTSSEVPNLISSAAPFQIDELKLRNEELHQILIGLNPEYHSIHDLVSSEIKSLDELKFKLLANPNGPNVEISTIARRPGKNMDMPITVVFKNEGAEKMSNDVHSLIKAFDVEKLSAVSLAKELERKSHGIINEDMLIRNKLFKSKTVGQSLEIIELIQMELLMLDYKKMTAQFDHTFNMHEMKKYASSKE